MIARETDPTASDWIDKGCAILGAGVPVGIVLGNVGFELMISLVGGLWMIRCILSRDQPFHRILKHPLIAAWLVWLAAIIVSLLWNGPGSKGWAHDFVFIRYPLYLAALLDISKRIPIGKYFLLGFAAGVLWAALNTTSAYILGVDFLGKPLIRYTGKLKEASRISGMAAYAAPFFLARGLLDGALSKKLKYVCIAIALIAFAQVLQTHVRTAIVAALVGIMFCGVWVIRQRLSVKVAMGLVVLFIFAAGVFFHIKQLYRFDTLYDRIYFWKVAWAMWQDHPVVGVGVSSFQDVFQELAASGAVSDYTAPNGITYRAVEQTHAHNLFFMLIACTGLFGLSAFAWLYVTAVRFIYKTLDGERMGLIVWPVVFLTLGITGFNIFHSWYQALFAFFMVLIGMEQTNYRHA